MCGHIDPPFQTACHGMTPFLFFTFCCHLMNPIFKMLSHLMTPFFRIFIGENGHALTEWHPFSLINDDLVICTQYLFGRRIYVVAKSKFALRLSTSRNDPLFFFKLKFSLKDLLLFIALTKWPPIFFCPHWKTPFFLYLVCHWKTPTLGVVAAHTCHFHMWVPPREWSAFLFYIMPLCRQT